MNVQVDDVWEVTGVVIREVLCETVDGKFGYMWTGSKGIRDGGVLTGGFIMRDAKLIKRDGVDRPGANEECSLTKALLFSICTEEEYYACDPQLLNGTPIITLDANGELPKAKEVNRYEDETEWLSAKDLSKYLGIGYSTALILIIKKGWFVKRDGGRSGGTAKKLCALSEIAEDFPKIVENMKSMAKPKEEKGYVDRPVQHNNKEYFCDATNGLFVTLANAVSRVGFMGFIWEEGGVERAANFCVAWRSEDGVLGFGESEGETIEHCKAVRFAK